MSLLAADGARLQSELTTVAILLTAMAQWVAARIFWRVNRLVSLLLIVAGGALVIIALLPEPATTRAVLHLHRRRHLQKPSTTTP